MFIGEFISNNKTGMWRYQQNAQDFTLAKFPLMKDVINSSDFLDSLDSISVIFSDYSDLIVNNIIDKLSKYIYQMYEYRHVVYTNTERWKSEFIAEIILYLTDNQPLIQNIYRNIEDKFYKDYEEWKNMSQDTGRNKDVIDRTHEKFNEKQDIEEENKKDINFNGKNEFDGKQITVAHSRIDDTSLSKFFDVPQTSVSIETNDYLTNATASKFDRYVGDDGENTTTDVTTMRNTNVENENNKNNRATDSERDINFTGDERIKELIGYDHHIERTTYDIPNRIKTLTEAYNVSVFANLITILQKYFISTRFDVSSYD